MGKSSSQKMLNSDGASDGFGSQHMDHRMILDEGSLKFGAARSSRPPRWSSTIDLMGFYMFLSKQPFF